MYVYESYTHADTWMYVCMCTFMYFQTIVYPAIFSCQDQNDKKNYQLDHILKQPSVPEVAIMLRCGWHTMWWQLYFSFSMTIIPSLEVEPLIKLPSSCVSIDIIFRRPTKHCKNLPRDVLEIDVMLSCSEGLRLLGTQLNDCMIWLVSVFKTYAWLVPLQTTKVLGTCRETHHMSVMGWMTPSLVKSTSSSLMLLSSSCSLQWLLAPLA